MIGFLSKHKGWYAGKSVLLLRLKCDGDAVYCTSLLTLCFQEKFLGLIIQVPVPRTDTGGQGEYPKVSERTMGKELGKMTP